MYPRLLAIILFCAMLRLAQINYWDNDNNNDFLALAVCALPLRCLRQGNHHGPVGQPVSTRTDIMIKRVREL